MFYINLNTFLFSLLRYDNTLLSVYLYHSFDTGLLFLYLFHNQTMAVNVKICNSI